MWTAVWFLALLFDRRSFVSWLWKHMSWRVWLTSPQGWWTGQAFLTAPWRQPWSRLVTIEILAYGFQTNTSPVFSLDFRLLRAQVLYLDVEYKNLSEVKKQMSLFCLYPIDCLTLRLSLCGIKTPYSRFRISWSSCTLTWSQAWEAPLFCFQLLTWLGLNMIKILFTDRCSVLKARGLA